MAKRKHAADQMLVSVSEYLSNKGSYRQIARANGISERRLRGWVREVDITRASYEQWLKRNVPKAERK